MDSNAFKDLVRGFYRANGRTLPWRETHDPYAILVSEMMLQQTQVSRVIPKYEAFLDELPTLEALAAAPLSLVLELWSGLGYNRRAKYLHDAAKDLVKLSSPWGLEDLVRQKGIGSNTAAAICVYAFNQPHVFIETNIRSVFLHHFFTGLDPVEKVSDKEILPIIQETLDLDDPRTFYWALMDYGSHLKKTVPNPSRASRHHTRQSTFAGSRRQLRGLVLRQLLATSSLSYLRLSARIKDDRLGDVLCELTKDGLIYQNGTLIRLAD